MQQEDNEAMIILGIDPGTATTGYGVVKIRNQKSKIKNQLQCLAYGYISTDAKLPSPKRLQKIYLAVSHLINQWRPNGIAVETVYFFKNVKTAMPVSQAKGVILLAAAQKKIPVYEYTPLQVKSVVAGYGAASKQQVQRMMQQILGFSVLLRPDDAADALGVALCHIYSIKRGG